jgi:hypothetical protein
MSYQESTHRPLYPASLLHSLPRWPACAGLGGRYRPESTAEMGRNTQRHSAGRPSASLHRECNGGVSLDRPTSFRLARPACRAPTAARCPCGSDTLSAPRVSAGSPHKSTSKTPSPFTECCSVLYLCILRNVPNYNYRPHTCGTVSRLVHRGGAYGGAAATDTGAAQDSRPPSAGSAGPGGVEANTFCRTWHRYTSFSMYSHVLRNVPHSAFRIPDAVPTGSGRKTSPRNRPWSPG